MALRRWGNSPLEGDSSFAISTLYLPLATVGTGYSVNISTTGGVAPISWTIISVTPNSGGQVPTGAFSGTLAFTPTSAETEGILVRAVDSRGVVATRQLSLAITGTSSSYGYYDGTITVSGNRMINGHGVPTQLRGGNVSGMEDTYLQAQSMTDPTNGQTPIWANYGAGSSWKLNCVIIPLHEASILEQQVFNGVHGKLVYDYTGTMHIMDLSSNYLTWLDSMVAAANNAGMYVVLSMHSTAPANMCLATTTSNNIQDMMTNGDNTPMAQWIIANRYKNNPAVLYDLKCEPWLDQSIGQTLSGSAVSVMMNGGTSTKTQQDIPGNYKKFGMLAVSNISGVFRPGDTITQGAVTATVGAFDGGGKILTLGTITGGAGYTNGTYALPVTGSATFANNAIVQFVVAGGTVTSAKILVNGQGFQAGESITAQIPGGTGFSAVVATVSSPLIYFTPDSAAFTTGTLTKSAGRAAMTRLTGMPAYVSSGTAANLTLSSTTNNNSWGSSGTDSNPTIIVDFSAKVAAGVKSVLLQLLTGAYEYFPSVIGVESPGVPYPPWLPVTPGGPATYTATLSAAGAGAGSVSANLAKPWALLSGTYPTVFTNPAADSRTATFTFGTTAITWTGGGLTNATTGPSLTLSNVGNESYDVPGAWNIYLNSAAGGTEPTSGWIQVQNTFQNQASGVHQLIQLYSQYTTYNWIKVSFTGSAGSASNTRIDCFADWWDGTYGVTDGAYIFGDSRSANDMGPGSTGAVEGQAAIQAYGDTMDMCHIGGFITGGSVTTAGTGGTANAVYNGIVLTGGSGQGAVGNITVSGGVVTSCIVTGPAGGSPGYGYVAGDALTTSSANIGGVSGFQYTVSSVQGAGRYAGAYPPIINGGQPGWTMGQWAAFAPLQIQGLYGPLALINLGTNNLPNTAPSQVASFQSGLQSFCQWLTSQGKIPVLSTIGWTGDTQHNPGFAAGYNTAINALISAGYGIAGPDLYTALLNNSSWCFPNTAATQCTTSGTTLTVGGTITGPTGSESGFQGPGSNTLGGTCTFGLGGMLGLTIVSQLSGTTGGAGTYQLSAAPSGGNITTPEPMSFTLYQLHEAGSGAALCRTMWAQWMCSYNANTASATVTNAAAGYPLAGFAQLHDVTQAAGGFAATAPICWSCLNYSDDNTGWYAAVQATGRTNVVHSMHLYPPESQASAWSVASAGTGWNVGDTFIMAQPAGGTVYKPIAGTVLTLTGGAGTGVATVSLTSGSNSQGNYLTATSAGSQLPANPLSPASTSGSGTGFSLNVTSWGGTSGTQSIASRAYAVTIGATYPVFNLETGEHFQPGLTAAPWHADFLPQADSQFWSMGFWTLNPWAGNGPGDDVMIQNSAGLPTSGQGTFEQGWTAPHL